MLIPFCPPPVWCPVVGCAWAESNGLPSPIRGEICACGDTYTADEVDALGHTEEAIPGKDPTCTEAGWEAYEYCTACDHSTKVEIPAKGHTPGEAVKENEVAPTLNSTGSYDSVVYCSVCNEELSRTTVTVPALGGADNNIQIIIRLSWDAGDSTGSQEFVFKEDVVQAVYGSNRGAVGVDSYGQMFTMVITGIENVQNLQAHIVIVSDTNVERSPNSISINR